MVRSIPPPTPTYCHWPERFGGKRERKRETPTQRKKKSRRRIRREREKL